MVSENFRMRVIDGAVGTYSAMYTNLDKKALNVIKKLWWYSKREYEYYSNLSLTEATQKFNLTEESAKWLEDNVISITTAGQATLKTLIKKDLLCVKYFRQPYSYAKCLGKTGREVMLVSHDVVCDHFVKKGLASDVMSDEEITDFMRMLGKVDPWLPNHKYVYKKLNSKGFKCNPNDCSRYKVVLLVELKSEEKA